MRQLSFQSQSSMTIGSPCVPEGICMLSDCGKERPDRLVNSKAACGTMEVTRPGGVAVDEAGEDDSGDECESTRDAVEPCGGQ